MKEYRRILKKNRTTALGLILLTIFSAAADVAAGYSLGWILDSYEAKGNRIHALILSSLACFALWMLSIGIDYLREISLYRTERILKNDLREMISLKLSSLPYDQLTDRDSGAYISWLSNDADVLYEKSFRGLFRCIRSGFGALFAFSVMTASSWMLGAAAAALFCISFAAPQLFSKKLERAAARRSAALEVSMEAYKDTIMGAGLFYLSGLHRRIVERIGSASDQAEQEIFFCNRTNQRVGAFLAGLNITNQLMLSAVAAFAAIQDLIPLGITLSVANLCGQFFNGLQNFMESIMAIRSTKSIWEKFKPIETPSEEKSALAPIEIIRFENLSFAYGDPQILRSRSLSFRTDGKYAIVGESGSGKTTILKLILGLLPGYSGGIFYDSTEQKNADLSTLYDQIAYVDQQVYLFQDTLRFNLTLGRSYSDAEIMKAVRAAKLEKFVESLPDGLDSVILENGKNLSGGQRQRIALARGLIRRAKLILLDEGTSALDEENAADIEQSLMDSDCGVIFITHHLRGEIKNQLTGVYNV